MALGKTYFKASIGWLDGFKVRIGITFKTVCGESVHQEVANAWKHDVVQTMLCEKRLLKTYFNVDETGWFFNVQQTRHYHLKKIISVVGKTVKRE